ncbi:MAG TPA: glycosyltransferase family 2 protein [Polyangia bacterium]|nr:glycosyltransferase family 2 protein [Polyangia bacterium]
MSAPRISIVIPVYNEEGILASSLADLRERLGELGWSYEILVAENGSRDRTVAIAEQLAKRHPELRVLSLGEANYGAALRRGILEARGDIVICDEIDLCDVDFYQRAVALLDGGRNDLVIGSKVMAGSQDRRPLFRRVATQVINGMLRVLVDFRGTDTHGLKAFRRESVAPVAERCKVDRDLFASEFVIRAYREGKQVVEIPVEVIEKRKPSINLMKRVPNVLKNMVRLTVLFRFRE